MLYYPEVNIAFAHYPRTGGTSTRSFINSKFEPITTIPPRSNEHVPLSSEIGRLSKIGVDFYNIRAVLVGMRNPFAAVLSLYFWWRNGPTSRLSFPEFVKKGCGGWDYQNFLFVNNKVSENVEIIKFEKGIKEELYRILNVKLNLNVDMSNFPHLHKVEHEPFMSYYTTKEMIDKVVRKFNWVFDQGYYEIPEFNLGEIS